MSNWGSWFRSYGNEKLELDEDGLMRVRLASINDLQFASRAASTSGPRPSSDDHLA